MTYLRASSLVVALALAGGTAAAYAQTGAAQSNSTAGGSTMSPAGGNSTDATATGTGTGGAAVNGGSTGSGRDATRNRNATGKQGRSGNTSSRSGSSGGYGGSANDSATPPGSSDSLDRNLRAVFGLAMNAFSIRPDERCGNRYFGYLLTEIRGVGAQGVVYEAWPERQERPEGQGRASAS